MKQLQDQLTQNRWLPDSYPQPKKHSTNSVLSLDLEIVVQASQTICSEVPSLYILEKLHSLSYFF